MDETLFDTEFDLLESDPEFDSEDVEAIWDDSRRRGRPGGFRGRPGIKLPPRGNAVPQRPAAGYATKGELDATAKRLDGRIQTNATAIKSLDTRARATDREIASMGTALRKEIALRKKETADLKKGLDESRQIAMILPLIGGGDDKFSKMLPVLLYGGMFGSSGGSTSSTDSNNSMLMTMMMVMALQP